MNPQPQTQTQPKQTNEAIGPKRIKCYVASGKHHFVGEDGRKKVAHKGEAVHLTPNQYETFKNKLSKKPIVDEDELADEAEEAEEA